MKRRKNVGERTEPLETPLETEGCRGCAINNKYKVGLQYEEVKLWSGSLANKDLCQTLSNVIEISRVTTNDSMKSLREDNLA